MTSAQARTAISRLVGQGTDVALTSAELDDLVLYARRADADGLDITDVAWVPTYAVEAAAVLGIDWQIAKVASTAVDFTSVGGSYKVSQVVSHLRDQQASLRRRIAGSLGGVGRSRAANVTYVTNWNDPYAD